MHNDVELLVKILHVLIPITSIGECVITMGAGHACNRRALTMHPPHMEKKILLLRVRLRAVLALEAPPKVYPQVCCERRWAIKDCPALSALVRVPLVYPNVESTPCFGVEPLVANAIGALPSQKVRILPHRA